MSKMSGFREYLSEYRILLDNVKNCDVLSQTGLLQNEFMPGLFGYLFS